MRIVHVLTRLLRAGSEENTLASCRAQAANGHEVWVVHGREWDRRWETGLGEGLIREEVASLVHPLAPADDLRAFLAMTALFKKIRPDVVHTHQSKAGIIGRFAARAAGVPVIVHGVHIVPFINVGTVQRLVYLAAEKAAAAVTHAFIDVSRGMKDVCLEAGVGRPEQHHVIHSGFDLSRFSTATPPDDWRELLGLDADAPKPPVVLMLAALEPRKRHCEFIEALPRLLKNLPDVRVVMAGEGPHRAAVEAKIRSLGLERSVRLAGYRTDPERLIALADVCTLTSTREGLPRVVMQYLSGGRSCVACDLPGLDEVLRDDDNGVVVGPDDITGAVDALAALLTAPDRLRRLTAAAAATDLSSWQVETMCRRIEEVYAGLVAR